MTDFLAIASNLWKESFAILAELAASHSNRETVSGKLNRWLRDVAGWMGNYCPDAAGAEACFRQAVSLRLQAVHIIERARNKGIELPLREVSTITAFSSTFRYKIGKRDDFEFHSDGFSAHIKNWKDDLSSLLKRQNNSILEIGCFEGFSTCWILETLVRGNSASVICVDPFSHEYFQDFKRNISKTGKRSKVRIRKGRSQEILRGLPLESFDFIYVDGSCIASDVLQDAVLAWRLLKPGGIMTFDRSEFTEPNRPSVGDVLDFFLRCHASSLDLVRNERQVTVVKRPQR